MARSLVVNSVIATVGMMVERMGERRAILRA